MPTGKLISAPQICSGTGPHNVLSNHVPQDAEYPMKPPTEAGLYAYN